MIAFLTAFFGSPFFDRPAFPAMKPQPDLFAQTLPTAQDLLALPAAEALKIRDVKLTPAQARFNRLLARVDGLAQRLAATRASADALRPAHMAALAALQAQHLALVRQMVVELHARLQRKAALTAAQKRMAAEMLCTLSAPLAAKGDAEMAALHDQYSPQSLLAKQQADAAEMHAMLEDMLGQPLQGKADADDPDALLREALRQMEEKSAAAREKREARKARRPKSARQQQAEQTQHDAQTALRTVFRQLASALHPDREQDPAERQRKTALMSEANAAYAARDLTTLLRLQLQLASTDPEAVLRLADDKINALAVVLKDQVSALERDLEHLQQQVCQEFELPPHAANFASAEHLARYLVQAREEREEDLALMTTDLQRVQDDAEFKRWLKEQKALSQLEQLPDLMAELVRGAPRRR
ncbi:MAG: hypothetical protein CVU30_13200 [Betaproteobacteria bacterium HGW-Betaproteobacteria-3]|nr:MAG: hypothetical protein CVU30_13200 [Betaproteobacteria bacterium HGW-Betaproteobacteria-3]